MPIPIPTPAPVSPQQSSAPPTAPISTPAPSQTPRPVGNIYIDGEGVIRSIYYEGRSIVVSCAPNTTCRVEFAAGSEISGNLNPPVGWDVNAPDIGIVVQTKASHSYALMLHADPSAANATYGYVFPDAYGHVILPSDKPVTVSSEDETTHTESQSPLAPGPCPKGYNVYSQNNPTFWPHMVFLDGGGVSASFPATGIVPVAAVPVSEQQQKMPLDLSRLANIAQSGGIDGTDRIVHIMSCYPTIVLYLGFGRDRRAVILEAQP